AVDRPKTKLPTGGLIPCRPRLPAGLRPRSFFPEVRPMPRPPLSRSLLVALALLVGSTPVRAAEPAPATVTAADNSFVLDNGLVSLTLAKHGGKGSSIKFARDGKPVEVSLGRNCLYFDVGGGRVYPVDGADGRVVSKGPDAVEVAWDGKPSAGFPFATEFHC